MRRLLLLLFVATLLAACDKKAVPTPPTAPAPATEEPPTAPREKASPSFVFTDRWAADRPQDAAKRPFDIDACYALRHVSEPTWSPDGTRVLFVVTSTGLHEGKTSSHIWLASPGGPPPRALTKGDVRDWSPRWHPDGRQFLFTSLRGGKTQLWTMPVDGGEPEQLTTIATGVSGATWSPDGAQVAFVSQVFPEYGADDAENESLLEDIADAPTKAYLTDHLFYRHWTSWGDGRRNHILLLDVASGEIRDLTPGDFDSPASGGHGSDGFVFSPDGTRLCFASNRGGPDEQAWTTNKDLFEVEIATGKLLPRTADNPAYDGHPSYSPDGAWIAYQRQAEPGYESDQLRLALTNPEGGTPRLLAPDFDNWILDFQWEADGRALVFRAPERGRYGLYRVPLDGDAVEPVSGIPSAQGWEISERGDIVFASSAVGRPIEIFVRHAEGGRIERLTALNDEVRDRYDLRPVEEMWVEGAEGRKVHVFLVKPHGFTAGRRYPLVINVHGGPQMQWADLFRADWQMYPGAGYVLAFPNPHGSTGYGQAYTAGISKDYGGKVMKDLDAVTEALSKLDCVDPERMGAMGWSWGGYAMAWLAGHSERFQALAAMMPVYDLRSFYGATEELWFPEYDVGATPWQNPEEYARQSPSTYAARFRTPTLVLTGERDFRVPYTQGLQFFTALRRQDVPARLVVFPNDGHWPSHVKSMPLYYAAHLDWFHRYLGGAPSPYDPQDMVRGRAFPKTDE